MCISDGLAQVFREFRVACVHLRKERDALDSLEETGASLHGGGVTLAVLRTQPTSGVLGSACFDLFSRHLWIFHDTARPLTGLV